MPIDADVYRVLIASPSDVEEERSVARDVVTEWNGTRSREDICLEPVMYETHVAPDLGRNPQEIITEQVVESCDLVIGMFWKRIGTETENYPGGAVEEVKQFYDEDSRAIVGFCERPTDLSEIDTEQYRKLEAFREECERSGLVFSYESVEEFRHLLSQHLARTMAQLTSAGGDDEIAFERKEARSESEYDPTDDSDRLEKQVDFHVEFDRTMIEAATDRLESVGIEQPYQVLDVGCGYGNLTNRLFGGDDRFEVLAFDHEEDVVRAARDDFAADNISYEILDANEIDAADLPTYDIVFAAFVMHHIRNQESVLSRLWDHLAPGGAFFCRSVDDGPHLHYPPSDDLEYLMEKDSQVKGSDDRFHGRRMYTQLNRLNPQPERVDIEFKLHTTANLTSTERETYFDVFHAHRIIDVRRIAKGIDATEGDRRLYREMRDRLEAVRNRFIDNEHLLDVKPVPVALAHKPQE